MNNTCDPNKIQMICRKDIDYFCENRENFIECLKDCSNYLSRPCFTVIDEIQLCTSYRGIKYIFLCFFLLLNICLWYYFASNCKMKFKNKNDMNEKSKFITSINSLSEADKEDPPPYNQMLV